MSSSDSDESKSSAVSPTLERSESDSDESIEEAVSPSKSSVAAMEASEEAVSPRKSAAAAVEGSDADDSGSDASLENFDPFKVFNHPPHLMLSFLKDPDHRTRVLKEEITVEKRRPGEYNPGLDPKMFSLADCYLSIEWVKWTKMAKPGSLKIYGEIKVEGDYKGKCNYIYHRHGYEAETIESAAGEDVYLNLSGPNYGLHNRDVGYIICNLFLEGGKPLVYDYFPVKEGLRLETGELVLPEKQSIHEPVDVPCDLGELRLCFTRILFSMPAKIQIFVMADSDTQEEISVSGTIYVTQNVKDPKRGDMSRSLVLLDKKSPSDVKMGLGDAIPLSRSVVVTPLQTYASRYHGYEGSLTFEYELEVNRFMVAKEYKCYGSTRFEIEDDGKPVHQYIILKHKRKRRRRPSPSGSGHDGLKIKIFVAPFHEWHSVVEEEKLLH